MASNLNIQLTDELRRYVDERASDDDVYSTPSEYIRDLIRKDREQQIVSHITHGIRDIGEGRYREITPMEIFLEETR